VPVVGARWHRAPFDARLMVLMWLAFSQPLFAQEAGKAERAKPVVVATAQMRTMAPRVWLPGNVISRHDADVAVEVSGRVVHIVDVGTRVKANDVVARIDDTLLKLERLEILADIDRIDARLRFLNKEVARLQRLAKQNNAARKQIEETGADRDATRSELAAARVRLQRIDFRLDRSTVRAPFDGVVVERAVQAGEWLDSGDGVIRLVGLDDLEVQVRLPVTLVDAVHVGAPLLIKDGAKEVTASVRSLVPVGDLQSRLFEIRVPVSRSGWLPGQAVKVAVPTAPPSEVVVVPRDSLVIRRSGISVFRVGPEHKTEKVVIETGLADGRWIEVKGGIRPGDLIVTRGGERLRPGQKVQILNAGDLG